MAVMSRKKLATGAYCRFPGPRLYAVRSSASSVMAFHLLHDVSLCLGHLYPMLKDHPRIHLIVLVRMSNQDDEGISRNCPAGLVGRRSELAEDTSLRSWALLTHLQIEMR